MQAVSAQEPCVLCAAIEAPNSIWKLHIIDGRKDL